MKIKRSQHVTSKGFFRYSEFYKSATYPALAKGAPFTGEIAESIFYWVESCGDRFRQANPKVRIRVLSGVRTLLLNEKVGGSSSSDHLFEKYSAVDVCSPDIKSSWVFCRIIEMDLPYRQLIWYPNRNFIHWSWNVPGKPFKEEVKIV